jgi:pimeloyl-ACP methyl ester carboxylesterase
MTELTDVDTEGEDMNISDEDDYSDFRDDSNLNSANANNKLADKIVLICQPNAAMYELSCYNEQLLNFYLKKGITIVLWNYRGYGRSYGSPTMENMAQDGQNILRMIKKRLKPSKLMIYGRSLGGHVAKSMCETGLVDAIVLDRTFSSIGYVPREMMGKWAQLFFDCFVDTDETYSKELMEVNVPKIVMFDPNDEIIGLFVSIATDLSIESASKFFNYPVKRISKSLPPVKKLLPKFIRRTIYNNKDFDQNLKLIDKFSTKILPRKDQLSMFMAIKRIFSWIQNFKGNSQLRRYLITHKKVSKEMARNSSNATFSGSGGRGDQEPLLDDYEIEDIDLEFKQYPKVEKIIYDDYTLYGKNMLVDLTEALYFIESASFNSVEVFHK